jgi:hypothetical protein
MKFHTGFINHGGKSFGKFSKNITGSMGQGISDVFISPIQDLTQTTSDFLSSPTLMIGVGLIGVIAVTTIIRGSQTANVALQNPESIRALAEAVR